jgi:hypothetical protein
MGVSTFELKPWNKPWKSCDLLAPQSDTPADPHKINHSQEIHKSTVQLELSGYSIKYIKSVISEKIDESAQLKS